MKKIVSTILVVLLLLGSAGSVVLANENQLCSEFQGYDEFSGAADVDEDLLLELQADLSKAQADVEHLKDELAKLLQGMRQENLLEQENLELEAVYNQWLASRFNVVCGQTTVAARCYATIYDEGAKVYIGSVTRFELVPVTGPALQISSWTYVDMGNGDLAIMFDTTNGYSGTFFFKY